MYLHTEIEIEATPDRVWRVLTDFERYREWNPFLRSVSGDPRPGEQLTLSFDRPNGKPMLMRTRVSISRENRELRWVGRIGLAMLFRGEHSFVIDQTPRGSVIFTQGELYSGLLVKLSPKKRFDWIRRGFEQMNEALKARAELGESAGASSATR